MKRSWSRIFAVAMAIPLLLILLAACGSGATTSNTKGSTTIYLGTELPVSGQETSAGKPAENGVRLAIEQATRNNTIPGYTLSLVAKDDVGPDGAHNADVGKANITALIGNALVAGVVGPFNSSVAVAEMPVANQAPIALISPSNTNTCLTQTGASVGCVGANDIVHTMRPTGKVTYFRIATTDSHQGAVLADFLYKQKNYKTVYVIDDTETYGKGIADVFQKQWGIDGGNVLGRKSLPKTTTSYLGTLTAIAQQKPDVIFFGGNDSTGGINIRKQMLTVPGLTTTAFAGGDGIQTSNYSGAVGTAGGPQFSTVAAVNPNVIPSAQKFINDYNARFGAAQYGAYAAGGYDCANIIIQAVKKVISDGKVSTPTDSNDSAGAKAFRQAVIDAILGISYDGVTGHQSFDKNGDTTDKIIAVYQIADVKGSPAWKFLTQLTLQ